LPPELTETIVQYADPGTSLLGQPGVSHPPLAYVSNPLRTAYLQQKSRFDFGTGKRPLPYGPAYIGETLSFPDLKTLARFFTNGPGRRDAKSVQGKYLAHVTFIRIVYRDDWAMVNWASEVRYAYEAFELLVSNLDRMHLQRLQICVQSYPPFGIDSPGVWSLLKTRGLQAVIISSRRGEVQPAVRRALQTRLCWPTSRRWRPLGFENPGPGDWHTHVSQEGPGDEWERQYDYLEQRYKTLHDRQTVDARLKQQRKSHDRLYGTRHQARKHRCRQRRRQAETERRASERRCRIMAQSI
jgi:hypothetical protein